MTKEISEDIKTIVSDKYLSYAISTIISRSLPDVRDGLKPVHRRIIYSMYELNLKPKSPFKKSARIVGDVMGKYHPHGDSAIYDAMVRMAQSFSIRYPLVEGQGNFGNIDGDNPAAMRYTEARLDENANNLLNGLDQNAVNFIDNYDGQNKEPVVLPALVPNILLNGSTGIAVGMATNIPSHNLKEITEALIELIRNSKITNNKLIKIIKGPDFPTGGEILMNNQNLIDIYSKGKGSFTNRAKWRKVNLSKGLYNIEIYEIPYSINKNRIIENIANLIKDKKIPIDDVWDDSDENIRILIKPKNRNIQPNKLMDVLFKYTDLSVKFHCNFNVLIDGKIPKLLGLKDILLNFIQHRKDVVKRISIFKINKISIRIEILLGLLIAYKNIDKIIKIIRKSKDPKIELKKKFRLKENQVIAILDMKLRSLRKIEENELRKELKKLKNELIFLKKLIKSQSELNKYLIKEFEKYLIDTNELNLERKTNIFIDDNIEKQDTKIEEFEDIEDLTLVCSQKDNIKIYKGHISFDNIGFNNDKLKYSLKIKSNDKIMFFTNDGKLYSLTPEIFPGGKSNGSNFSFFVNLNSISKIIGICAYKKDFKCLLASKKSKGFIYNPEESPKVQKNGKQIFNLKKEDKLIKMIYPLNKFVATVSSYQKLLIFNINEIPELKKSSGVLLQQIKDGDLCDVQLIDNNEGLQWNIGKQLRQEKNFDFWLGKRSQVGKKVPKRFNKELKFI